MLRVVRLPSVQKLSKHLVLVRLSHWWQVRGPTKTKCVCSVYVWFYFLPCCICCIYYFPRLFVKIFILQLLHLFFLRWFVLVFIIYVAFRISFYTFVLQCYIFMFVVFKPEKLFHLQIVSCQICSIHLKCNCSKILVAKKEISSKGTSCRCCCSGGGNFDSCQWFYCCCCLDRWVGGYYSIKHKSSSCINSR